MNLRLVLEVHDDELARRAPEVRAALHHGIAPETTAAALEAADPPRRPSADLLTWFAWHNGGDYRKPVFGGWWFMPIEAALKHADDSRAWTLGCLSGAVPICYQDGPGTLWVPNDAPGGTSEVWLERPGDDGREPERVASCLAELVAAWTALLRLGLTWEDDSKAPHLGKVWTAPHDTPLPPDLLAQAGYPLPRLP